MYFHLNQYENHRFSLSFHRRFDLFIEKKTKENSKGFPTLFYITHDGPETISLNERNEKMKRTHVYIAKLERRGRKQASSTRGVRAQ